MTTDEKEKLIEEIKSASANYQRALEEFNREHEYASKNGFNNLSKISLVNIQIYINMLDFCEIYRMAVTSGARDFSAKVISRHVVLRAYEMEEAFFGWVGFINGIAEELREPQRIDILNNDSPEEKAALKKLREMHKIRVTAAHSKIDPIELRRRIISVDISDLDGIYQAVLSRAHKISLYAGGLTRKIREEILRSVRTP